MIPACQGADTEMFYDSKRWGDAAKLCQGCPVKTQCLQEFMTDPYAYAGGCTPHQRSRMLARQMMPKPKPERSRGPAARSRVTDEQRTQVLAIFDTELVGPMEIGRRVDLAKSTVQRILRAAGRSRTPEENAELARRGGLSGGQKALGERNALMVMKLFGENYKAKEIAELTGLNLSTVYLIRRKNS
jgi:DNA invertase Pin-like site-specific DNA recombinase